MNNSEFPNRAFQMLTELQKEQVSNAIKSDNMEEELKIIKKALNIVKVNHDLLSDLIDDIEKTKDNKVISLFNIKKYGSTGKLSPEIEKFRENIDEAFYIKLMNIEYFDSGSLKRIITRASEKAIKNK
jgi:hypothetical protein